MTAYIACIQNTPHMPRVSETDSSPVIKSLPYIVISKLESEEIDVMHQEWHYDNLTKLTAYIAWIQHTPHMPRVSETDLSPVIKPLPYIDISLVLWRCYEGSRPKDHCKIVHKLKCMCFNHTINHICKVNKWLWEWWKLCDMPGITLYQSHQAGCIHCMHTTHTTYA